MLKHKISVVIPVFNGVRYISQAIESVINQNVDAAIEIIVVNDGSTDDTEKLIKCNSSAETCYAYSIRYIRIEHSGTVIAKNVGLRAATGNFIMFHDADDMLQTDALRVLLAELVDNQEIEAVFAQRKDFVSPELAAEKRNALHPKPEAYFGAIAGCALFRKDVFDRTGGFDESVKTGEAMALMLKIQQLGLPTKKLAYTSVLRRLHDSNLGVTDKKQEYADYLKILMAKNRKQ